MCCAVLLRPFVLLVYASTEFTKNVVLLTEKTAYYQQMKNMFQYLVKKMPRWLFRENPCITLVFTSKIKPYRVNVVWVTL